MKEPQVCGAAVRVARQILMYALALLAMPAALCAQIPDAPTPPRLVNDLAGVLPPGQSDTLERKLVAMDDSTSTQVTVVIVASLGGYDIAQFAQELGEKWGVGRKGRDNGVVMVVKPKNSDGDGRAFIATGYGLEGALPDVVCTRIVRDVMIPYFQREDYGGGISAGVDAIISAAHGEFEADVEDDAPVTTVFIITMLLILLYAAGSIYISHYNRAKSRRERITTTMTFFFIVATIYTTILHLLAQLGRSASRGGSRSGGGGSFGGFGGGSFGGGGGGGSW